VTKVGIIVGSTRPGRVGEQIARWVEERAQTAEVAAELIDLAEVALPFLDEREHPSSGKYANAHTQRWGRRIASVDALVLVTPEYNHSYSAPMKNALDYLSTEWRRKPVAMVGYGMTSAGTRAVQALLPVVVALGMIPAGAIYLPLRERINPAGVFRNTSHDDAGLDDLLTNLCDLTDILTPGRSVARVAS
jgi:NAD(P)H-dependent FMN reductase